jgi:phage repressor protein C with HTH and peptisase S24 domain
MAKAGRRHSTSRTSVATAAAIEPAGAPAAAGFLSRVERDALRRDLPKIRLTPPDAYGAILNDDSMVPVLMPGAIAIVHPQLPPRIGHGCVFRNEAGDLALIKEYLGQTDDHWQARQLNPPHEITLDRREWPVCHAIVGHLLDIAARDSL